MRFFTAFILILAVLRTLGQSQEALIQLEFDNYVSKETLEKIAGEGNILDGKKHGEWKYFMIYDHDIMYYKGHYLYGKKEGVWNNYALLPPMGYSNNYDLVRSTETWKDGLLYRFKMGQNNILVMMENGLGEPYCSELRRLDEAFENSYRRTHGKTLTPEFGESVESMQARLVPMIRDVLLKSKQKAELKFWTLGQKLKLYEKYDSGMIAYRLSQEWDNNTLYGTEIYENETLAEKYIYVGGNPNDVIQYSYYPNGDMEFMKHFENDTIPVGKWIENYPDGKKKSMGSYLNGVKSGKWKFWDEEGNVEVIKYVDGEPQ